MDGIVNAKSRAHSGEIWALLTRFWTDVIADRTQEPLPHGLTLVRMLATSPLSAARTREVEFERAPFLSLPIPFLALLRSKGAERHGRPPPSSQPPPPASTPLAARPAGLSRRRQRPGTKPPRMPRHEPLRPCRPVVAIAQPSIRAAERPPLQSYAID